LDELNEIWAGDVAIPDSQNAVSGSAEQRRASRVVARPFDHVMMSAIEFQDESQLKTTEVDDEPVQDVLAAELEAQHLSVPQQCPGMTLGRRRVEP
jgi:hypothetical protein